MQNLEQIRAAAAIAACKEKNDGSYEFIKRDVSGLPALIMTNGLLAAFAFATEKDKSKRAGMKAACDEIAKHLGNTVHGIEIVYCCKTGVSLIERLSDENATSKDLERATGEALAFLGHLRRYAPKEDKSKAKEGV